MSNDHAPNAIVFDWDNTLVNTWPVIHHALEKTYIAYDKKPMTLDEVMANVKYSLRDSFPEIFKDKWQEARDEFYRNFEKVHLQDLVPIDGSKDFLDELSKLQIPMALVSNKTGRYLRLEADHLDWSSFFINIIGAGDAKQDKPAVDPLIMALQGSDIQIDGAVWFVGDSEVDIQIAENAGCTGILLHTDSSKIEMKAVPDQVHQDFDSLYSEIRKYY
ncbi:MAG: HAD hydrolase-like protein [Alphaproteobacteria bacterium]|nr:HAD hydrolase-like protein [Alphaproteobacteria bacterium]